MTALLEKHIDALRQIDQGRSAELPVWLTFPLWDLCLIDAVPLGNAKRKYVLNNTGKLVLATHPFPRPNPDPDPEPRNK